MARAILRITPLPDGTRRIVVQCGHGTAVGGDLRTAPLPEPAAVAAIVLRHRQGWRCRCTRRLERQFPASLIPVDLRVAEVVL